MNEQVVVKGKYRLGECIGSGGMAEVFRAEVVGVDGVVPAVALKRLLPALSQDKNLVELFLREARILSRLRHPNIVSVFDYDRDEAGNPFLVMELVEGLSLHRLAPHDAAPEERLPFPIVVHILIESLRGLAHVHEHRDDHGAPLCLVHRDVSPRNVLVSWSGAVKLCDFGLAKSYAGTNPSVSGVKGTAAYMSPEQAGGIPLDARSDLFAMGVILYELLTGTRPFPGETVPMIMARILMGQFEPPRARRPEIPAELEAITLRLLQHNRTQRYPSARHAIEALLQCSVTSARSQDDLTALLRERPGLQGLQPASQGSARSHEHAAQPEPGQAMRAAHERRPGSELRSPGQERGHGTSQGRLRKRLIALFLVLGGGLAALVVRMLHASEPTRARHHSAATTAEVHTTATPGQAMIQRDQLPCTRAPEHEPTGQGLAHPADPRPPAPTGTRQHRPGATRAQRNDRTAPIDTGSAGRTPRRF